MTYKVSSPIALVFAILIGLPAVGADGNKVEADSAADLAIEALGVRIREKYQKMHDEEVQTLEINVAAAMRGGTEFNPKPGELKKMKRELKLLKEGKSKATVHLVLYAHDSEGPGVGDVGVIAKPCKLADSRNDEVDVLFRIAASHVDNERDFIRTTVHGVAPPPAHARSQDASIQSLRENYAFPDFFEVIKVENGVMHLQKIDVYRLKPDDQKLVRPTLDWWHDEIQKAGKKWRVIK
jgi:hypothetical protein